MAAGCTALKAGVTAILAAAALCACATYPPFEPAAGALPPAAPPSASPAAPTVTAPPAAVPPARAAPAREIHLSAATGALVSQARAQIGRGELPAASATLDRALRIEPNNALLWIERGRLRLAEGDAHQAESCGRKALALAAGDRSAQAQSNRLLADALRAQHRNREAREVESRLPAN